MKEKMRENGRSTGVHAYWLCCRRALVVEHLSS